MRSRFFLFTAILFTVFASCNNMPEDTKYIPKDAMIVVGVNTKELSKKIAWNAIMGSKLLDEMKAKMPDKSGAAEGLGDAGIDVLSTTYFYYTPNMSEGSYNYLTAIVPLSDAKKWEAYIQKNYKNPVVKQVGDRKETLLDQEIYAAWDDKTAIVRKVFVKQSYDMPTADNYDLDDDTTSYSPDPPTPKPEMNRLVADMNAAFTINKDNITDDKRFAKLQSGGNDVTFWMNYDVFMNKIGTMTGGMNTGLAVGGSLWKEAAYAAGIDFEKGKINADMKYFISDELREIYAKIGNKDADKDMIDRLPTQNLNMIMAANVSSDGVKAVLEKMGMLGFMSLALAQSNLTTDDVFQSFTGDMAMSLSNFRFQDFKTGIPTLQADHNTIDTHYVSHKDYSMNFIYALKIKDKTRFDKLLNYIKTQNGLESLDANTYRFTGNDSVFVTVDKDYVTISNNPATGKAYMAGTYKSQSKPEQLKNDVYGHPMGLFMDIQTMLNGIIASGNSTHETAMLDESKKLFKNAVIKGGDNKKEAFTFSGVLELMNKNENSLLQLLDYAMRMNEINKNYEKPATTSQPVAAASNISEQN